MHDVSLTPTSDKDNVKSRVHVLLDIKLNILDQAFAECLEQFIWRTIYYEKKYSPGVQGCVTFESVR